MRTAQPVEFFCYTRGRSYTHFPRNTKENRDWDDSEGDYTLLDDLDEQSNNLLEEAANTLLRYKALKANKLKEE